MPNADLQRRFQSFKDRIHALPKDLYQVEEVAPWVFVINPIQKSGAKIFGWQALNHGNEIGGFGIFEALTDLLESRALRLENKLVLGLGNFEAALAGKRFLENDLNRTYGGDGDSLEHRRAREIESIYGQCDFFLDLHQTQTPTPIPFYPITFTDKHFQLLRYLDPSAVIIKYPPTPLDGRGASLSRFLHYQDCVSITVELGEMGPSSSQIAFGLHLGLRLLGWEKSQTWQAQTFTGKCYDIDKSITAPGNSSWLASHMQNFSVIHPGEVIGTSDGKDWISEDSGTIVFPKAIAGHSRTQANAGEPIFVLATESEINL